MVKAHLAASFTIGDSAEDMEEIPDETCVCGQIITPLLGKVQGGTNMRWDVWIPGNYEHINKPSYPHAPVPKAT